jgi:hypothetical protein
MLGCLTLRTLREGWDYRQTNVNQLPMERAALSLSLL